MHTDSINNICTSTDRGSVEGAELLKAAFSFIIPSPPGSVLHHKLIFGNDVENIELRSSILNQATCSVLLSFSVACALANELSLSLSSSSSCVFQGAREGEGGHGPSPSTGLHPSASEHVLPAHARPAAAACRVHQS